MSAELTVKQAAIDVGNRGVELRSFDEMARFCKAVVNSNLAPKTFQSPEAVMVAIQHGMELGLAPMQALQSIAVINGRPCIWGDAALALATAHPDFEDIEETTRDTTAVCTVKRRNRTPVTREFSEADAKKAGLLGKAGPWTQYPKRMLQMRARAFAIRDAFPDALKGVGIREEISDIKPAQAREIKPAEGLVLPDEPEATTEPTTIEIKETLL
jgi:hypothetical protein